MLIFPARPEQLHELPPHRLLAAGERVEFVGRVGFGEDLSPLAQTDDQTKAQIVKLAETDPFPRNLVSVRKDLDPALAKRLKDVLLGMANDGEGRKILAKTDATDKFDALPGGEEAMRRQLVELFRPRGKN